MNAKELGDMPAYPVHPEIHLDSIDRRWAGMTKREAFAMAALPACYAEYFAGLARHEYPCEPGWATGVAIDSFRMADAMLAELAKESK